MSQQRIKSCVHPHRQAEHADSMTGPQNYCIQATPGFALMSFAAQVPGAPHRSLRE
jgi:hypothetical protein